MPVDDPTPAADLTILDGAGATTDQLVDHIQGYARDAANQAITEAYYLHTQSASSSAWYIVHDLGKYPSVTLVDSGGNHWEVEVEHHDTNSLTIHLLTAITGVAYCN